MAGNKDEAKTPTLEEREKAVAEAEVANQKRAAELEEIAAGLSKGSAKEERGESQPQFGHKDYSGPVTTSMLSEKDTRDKKDKVESEKKAEKSEK